MSLGCERLFGFRRCQLPADLRHQQKLQAAALAQSLAEQGQGKKKKKVRTPAAAAAASRPAVAETIPETVEYKNDFHWTGPTAAQLDGQDSSSAGLPTALELSAADAAACGTEGRRCELRLGHGSLICMENACQFLYRHSLLPEPVSSAEDLSFRQCCCCYCMCFAPPSSLWLMPEV